MKRQFTTGKENIPVEYMKQQMINDCYNIGKSKWDNISLKLVSVSFIPSILPVTSLVYSLFGVTASYPFITDESPQIIPSHYEAEYLLKDAIKIRTFTKTVLHLFEV